MGQAAQILDLIGIDAICEQILAGATYQEMANAFGVGLTTLHGFCNRTPENSARTAKAMRLSAEAWLDDGRRVLQSALRKDGEIDPTAARAYAQECARRAAIRNPKYSDKIVHAGDVDNPLQVQHTVAAPQITREEWLRLHGIGAATPSAPITLPAPTAQRVGDSEED